MNLTYSCHVQLTNGLLLASTKAKGQESKGARVLFELKKDGAIGSQERYQAQVELILANHWSRYFVLVVLTDLGSSYGKTVTKYIFTLRHRISSENDSRVY